jgi:hypothetical protein
MFFIPEPTIVNWAAALPAAAQGVRKLIIRVGVQGTRSKRERAGVA